MTTPDPAELVSKSSTIGLLRLYAAILTELLRRDVVRSRNAPAGDLAEHLAAIVYQGELAPRSAKSWDLRTAEGRRLQVKGRVITPGAAGNYSVFRSWDFDDSVFVQFDPATYDVTSAVEVPMEAVRSIARPTPQVNGHRVLLRDDLLALEGAIDRTVEFRQVLADLG